FFLKKHIPASNKKNRNILLESFDGNTFLHKIDRSVWEKVATVPGVVDEKNINAQDYETYHPNDK
ncbi:dihydrofolate reductase, partial [Enterococcus faecalis]